MPFGRWMRLVGWRHVVAVIMVAWALFPALYIISLSLSGGNTLTSACPPDRSGLAALSCLVPNQIDFSNYSTLLSSDQYPFVTWMKNSLILATGSAAGALLMGAAAAYAFSRMRFTRSADGHALTDAGADVPRGAGDHGRLPPADPDPRRLPGVRPRAHLGHRC